jgi:transmembrane sensor
MSRATSGLDPVEREAVDWLKKLAAEEMTPEDMAALQAWRARSPRHDAAFEEAKRLWHVAGDAGRDLGDPDQDFAARLDALGRRRKTTSRRAVLGGGLTALAAASAYGVFNPPLGLWPSLAELNSDYRTQTGEQRQLTLADVAINLNTQTSLTVRAGDDREARVELISGEASFATPARMERSLIVLAGAGRAIAESGRFEIRHMSGGEGGAVSVTCFDGDVRIERGTHAADLRPGQRLRYDASGLGQIAAVDPQRASEWQRGIVAFDGTPIAEAVDEINRYRPGRVLLMNASLGRKPLSGRFPIDRMDDALLGLERVFGAKLKYLPGGIVLVS